MQRKYFPSFSLKKAITLSLDNTIVVNNTDTEVHARDFSHNLRRKNGSFDPK